MAEEMIRDNVVEQTVQEEPVQETVEESGEYKIEAEAHSRFNAIAGSIFQSSTEFCENVSNIFHSVFADYEGCVLETYGNSLFLALYFNHRSPDGSEGIPFACTKEKDGKVTSNDTMMRLRRYNNAIINGDKYWLTEEGKSCLSQFMAFTEANMKNGQINWGKCVSDIADPQSAYNGLRTQMTKVSFVDPAKLAEFMYGENDEEGGRLVYNIRIIGSTPAQNYVNAQRGDRMIEVQRISEVEVNKLARMYGVVVSNGLNIVKATV